MVVEATPEAVYDLVSDITRTGEWSPVCTSCWWDEEADAGTVGAWFTGHNELPGPHLGDPLPGGRGRPRS